MPGGPLGRGGNAIWCGKEDKSHNKKEKAEAGCGQTNTTRAAVEVLIIVVHFLPDGWCQPVGHLGDHTDVEERGIAV